MSAHKEGVSNNKHIHTHIHTNRKIARNTETYTHSERERENAQRQGTRQSTHGILMTQERGGEGQGKLSKKHTNMHS